MPLDISSQPDPQDNSSIFFADPGKPSLEGVFKPDRFRHIGPNAGNLFRRGGAATHGFPIVPPKHDPPRRRSVVGTHGLKIGMGEDWSSRVRTKPVRVPSVPHFCHDPSLHSKGNAFVKFRVEPRKTLRLHGRHFGGVGFNPLHGVTGCAVGPGMNPGGVEPINQPTGPMDGQARATPFRPVFRDFVKGQRRDR